MGISQKFRENSVFLFFCFDLLEKYLVKNLVLMGRGRGIGSGRA